jgi:peptidoglycan/LPS O-acetylase OafA/YrhL
VAAQQRSAPVAFANWLGISGSMEHTGNTRYDVARGLAALVVFVAHINQFFVWRFFQPVSWPEMVSGWGARAAVLVFFLLSGLLITKSILSNIQRNGYFEPVDYLFNRIARLYPPLLFAVFLAAIVVSAIHYFGLPGSSGPLGTVRPTGVSFTLPELIRALLLYDGMTEADGPLWTLYIEVKFYFAAMGIAMAVRGGSPASRITGFVLIASSVWLGLGLYKFWFFAMIWTFGALANIPAMKRPAVFLPVALAAILLGYVYRAPYNDYVDNKIGLAIQAAGCAVVVYVLLLKQWAEFKFPNWLNDTGDFSYTLYVTHFPLLALGLSLSLSINNQSFPFAIAAAIVSAIASLFVVILVARRLEDVPKYKRYLQLIFVRAKPKAELA